ncbi:MAG: hypothetical protein A2622_09745 [Bdellovibrionales bacterium RIFCSPHIGHO2_01_FULL_40_29]|nr:MAG: hypothetical protein A2622_09745 [Bdellovibrionales bacterium RIFCSPHIGHO2_01_FULL_40_29]OFZ32469.1 MAG: hypothetical protein A3D17_12920 [Bdellovibrionales bacterium RIFCSPHIGHO2_02_FULL_40_15]
MRTLTQVWVFFVTLTITLLVIGFQLRGRLGLFLSFLFSLFLIYIILHRGVLLFKNQLSYKEQLGSDPTGFVKLLNTLNIQYTGGQHMDLHLFFAKDNTPPLVWKDYPNKGFIVIHESLLEHLTENEKKILAHFLLSHLKMHPTFRPRLFSVFEMGFLHLQFLFSPIISLVATLFRSPQYYLQSDLMSLQNSHASSYEFGYFLKKLHDFKFHSSQKLHGAEYFSVLTSRKHSFLKNYGQPRLRTRFLTVMGFVP